VRVGDGVDDEFGKFEDGGQVAELAGYFVGCACEVAGPLVVFFRIEVVCTADDRGS